MKPLRIVKPAELEYQAALRWYSDRDARVAERFAIETRRTLGLIESFPQIGGRVPDVEDQAVRQMPIRTFPYQVVFMHLPDRLEVVAFAHHRRRPAYFLDRLRKE